MEISRLEVRFRLDCCYLTVLLLSILQGVLQVLRPLYRVLVSRPLKLN